MIHVSYQGRTGNQLFQHAYSWLHCFGQATFDPVPGFPELPTQHEGEIYFESASHYLPRREEITKWFSLKGDPMAGIAVHVRGGDAAAEGFRCPPVEYYERAMEQVLGILPQVTVFTDDIFHPDAQQVAKLYGADLVSGDPLEDFHSMRRHKILVIGNSTFAWWAAFLSGHNNVIQCEPVSGWRSKLCPNTCLIVPEWKQIQYAPAKNL